MTYPNRDHGLREGKGTEIHVRRISERYDSISGKSLGVQDYCKSSTLITMMLNGLAEKHKLRLRGESKLRLDPRGNGRTPD